MMRALFCRASFSSDQRNASSISRVEMRVEKIEEYDLACTDSMNAMLVSTASSWGVTASGIRETAPTVPCTVSSRVRPVNTRVVMSFSGSFRVDQDWMSFESGIFSGSQKFPVRRSQTSSSFGSCIRFQLMAWTGPASSLIFSLTVLLSGLVVGRAALRFSGGRDWDHHPIPV